MRSACWRKEEAWVKHLKAGLSNDLLVHSDLLFCGLTELSRGLRTAPSPKRRKRRKRRKRASCACARRTSSSRLRRAGNSGGSGCAPSSLTGDTQRHSATLSDTQRHRRSTRRLCHTSQWQSHTRNRHGRSITRREGLSKCDCPDFRFNGRSPLQRTHLPSGRASKT